MKALLRSSIFALVVIRWICGVLRRVQLRSISRHFRHLIRPQQDNVRVH